MPKWSTLVIGLLVSAFGAAVIVEGSLQIVGVLQLVAAGFLIMIGVKRLRKKQGPQQPAAGESQEQPPSP